MIKPRHNPSRIANFIRENKLNGDSVVNNDSLKNWLAKSVLPDLIDPQKKSLQSLVEMLKPLPHREYSIASIPADGKLQLVVRQAHDQNGQLGLGSGRLTEFASANEILTARIKSNGRFHAPTHACAMILIGAGTGIAGLLPHLRARKRAGQADNWVIFGERQRERDRLFGDELDELKNSGFIKQLDEVFSRDYEGYVQDRLLAEQEKLKDWVANGAAIYVCGRLTGMGTSVEQALIKILGKNDLKLLRESGRYKREIY